MANEFTTWVNAAPTTTATARSTTLPRMMKSLNSVRMLFTCVAPRCGCGRTWATTVGASVGAVGGAGSVRAMTTADDDAGPPDGELVHLDRRDDGVAVVTLDHPKVNALSGALLDRLHAVAVRADRTTRRARWWSPAATGSSPPGPRSASSAAPTRPRPSAARFTEALEALAAIPRMVIAAVQRLRPGRRLRAGPGLRPALRLDQGQVRPARDPARHHPRRRRHPAPGPAGGPGPGQGPDPHRSPGRAPTRRWPSAWSTTWSSSPTSSCRRRPRPTRPSWRRGRWPAQALAKQAIDEGLDRTLADGLDLEQEAFVEVFRTEDASIGVASFLEHGPGPGHLHRSLTTAPAADRAARSVGRR